MNLFIMLSSSIMFLVEGFSRTLKSWDIIPDRYFKITMYMISLLLGLATPLVVPDLLKEPDILSIVNGLPHAMQVILVGITLGLGSKGVYYLFDVVGGLRKSISGLADQRTNDAGLARVELMKRISEMESRSNVDSSESEVTVHPE